MLDISMEYFILPTIMKPTRITHSSATLIDNIYVSNNLQTDHKSVIIIESISDHLPCFTMIQNVNTVHKRPKYITTRKLNEDKKALINEVLLNKDWHYLENCNVEEGYDSFYETLNNLIDTVAPEKKIRTKTKNIIVQPWMTPGLLKSSHKLQRLYRKSVGCKKISKEYIKYNNYRNKFNTIKRNWKKITLKKNSCYSKIIIKNLEYYESINW
jgi:hypothetical protein